MFRALVVVVAIGCGDHHDTPREPPATVAAAPDPLPSWRDGASKRAILEFVDRVTSAGSPELVPVQDRIAVFDDDGTLWTEQPVSMHVAFAFDHRRSAKRTSPTTEDLEHSIVQWLGSARDPRFGRRYTELVFQPMLELLGFLRSRGFKTYIVSVGGADLLRPWTDQVLGIPPEHVIGSRVATRYELRDRHPVLVQLPKVDLVEDRGGKPVGIEEAIGRRPLAVFGNSDGDFEMLEWTTAAPGRRLALIVHHTDPLREYAYDRDARIGRLARALDEAPRRGWIVVDTKRDWKVIFPFEGAR